MTKYPLLYQMSEEMVYLFSLYCVCPLVKYTHIRCIKLHNVYNTVVWTIQ